MSGNYFCHICGGLVDLIRSQPSGVRFCECEKRFAQLRAENERLTKQVSSYKILVKSMEETKTYLLKKDDKNKEAVDTLASEREANRLLTEENEELKAELAEAKKDAERLDFLDSLMLREDKTLKKLPYLNSDMHFSNTRICLYLRNCVGRAESAAFGVSVRSTIDEAMKGK